MTSGMYTQMMDIREELREGSRDRRIPDDPVTIGVVTTRVAWEGMNECINECIDECMNE